MKIADKADSARQRAESTFVDIYCFVLSPFVAVFWLCGLDMDIEHLRPYLCLMITMIVTDIAFSLADAYYLLTGSRTSIGPVALLSGEKRRTNNDFTRSMETNLGA